MRAVEVVAPGQWRLVERPVPEPGPGEVVVAVAASGICGTDLRIVAGDYGHARLPVVIGHEFSGVVHALGEGVADLAVGDLVAADPNLHCGVCRWCRQGAWNLCEDARAVGVSLPGAMAEYVAVPADVTVRLPAGTDPAAAAMIEPLSCVLHAVDRVGGIDGGSVLVYGGGAIGLLFLVVARRLGAVVDVVEPHEPRRALATRLGARTTAPSGPQLGEGEYHLVLDASGARSAIQDGVGRLATRGTFLQMGVAPSGARVEYSPYAIYERERRFVGSNSVADKFVAACELLPELAGQVAPLVTASFPLEDFGAALAAMADPATVKVQLVPNPVGAGADVPALAPGDDR